MNTRKKTNADKTDKYVFLAEIFQCVYFLRKPLDLQKTNRFEIFLQKCLFFKLYYLIFLNLLLRIYGYFALTAAISAPTLCLPERTQNERFKIPTIFD